SSSRASALALSELRFGAQPMFFRTSIWPTFFFPNLASTRFDCFAIRADRIGFGSRNSDARDLSAPAWLVTECVAHFHCDPRRNTCGMTAATDRIAAVFGREEKHRTFQK